MVYLPWLQICQAIRILDYGGEHRDLEEIMGAEAGEEKAYWRHTGRGHAGLWRTGAS